MIHLKSILIRVWIVLNETNYSVILSVYHKLTPTDEPICVQVYEKTNILNPDYFFYL